MSIRTSALLLVLAGCYDPEVMTLQIERANTSLFVGVKVCSDEGKASDATCQPRGYGTAYYLPPDRGELETTVHVVLSDDSDQVVVKIDAPVPGTPFCNLVTLADEPRVFAITVTTATVDWPCEAGECTPAPGCTF